MRILAFVASVLFVANAYSQAAITVKSNSDNIRFYLVLGEQQMNDFYENSVQIQNLPAGFHNIRIVFEGDSIADFTRNVMVKNGQEKTFQVTEKSDIRKSVNQSGRNAGKAADIGEHDESFNYLKDIYKLELMPTGTFTATGTEVTVSTDNSTSTSPLPASKAKR